LLAAGRTLRAEISACWISPQHTALDELVEELEHLTVGHRPQARALSRGQVQARHLVVFARNAVQDGRGSSI
jgi:hypothetical protein